MKEKNSPPHLIKKPHGANKALPPIRIQAPILLYSGPYLYNDAVCNITVILHNIRSLHNVGSIFRTADGAGISKLYLCGITPTPLDRFGKMRPELAKVALGAERNVPWEYSVSTARLVKKLRGEGYRVYALEQAENSIAYDSPKVSRGAQKIALILGDEVRGIPSSILKVSDAILEIPMRGKKESLNVSVAFGIAAYALMRR